ncbi:hypothetical protein LUZ60_017842 [Juncus effusus]|nr:hypothetical protein LUZ60_017842 [Juncus effusus]
MIGRADIEGSKSNVAMNAWLPQASYPCGNFSDTSSFKLRRSKGSIGHAFTMCRPSQTPHLTMSSARIDRPKPPWFQKEGKLPASASRNNRIPLVRTSSESAVRRPGKAPEGAVPGPSPGRHAATRSRRGAARAAPPAADGGCSPWRPDAVMSTTGRGRHSVLRIFKGRRGRTATPRDVRCSSGRWTLPPAEPFPGWAGPATSRLGDLNPIPFSGAARNRALCDGLPQPLRIGYRLTHVQVPFTWNLSPLRPSKFSFEYLLLPPRSAPTPLRPGSRPGFCGGRRAPPTHRGMEVARWPGVGRALQRQSISGLVDSADERFARQYRFGPPPEFPLASPRSGIVHHLSGPDRHAPTRTLHRRSGSASGDYPLVSFLAPPGFPHPSTRTHVRLLGPCFKTGRMGSPQADAYACRAAGHTKGRTRVLRPHRRRHPRQARALAADTAGSGPRPVTRGTAVRKCGLFRVRPGRIAGPHPLPLPAISSTLDSLFKVPFHLSLAVLVRYRSLASI